MKSKRPVLFLIIGLVVLLGWLGRSMRGGGAVEVETAGATLMALQSSILASGELSFSDSVELKPEVIGLVSEIAVDEGDRVEKGQVVIQLDQASYRARVDRQRAMVAQQLTAVDGQGLAVKSLSRELDRRRSYYAASFLSRSDLESETTKLDLAKIELESRKSGLLALHAELAQALEDLGKTVIRAPIAGVVTRLSVRPGETVVVGTNIAGSTLLEIADTSRAAAVVYVDEAEIEKVVIGAEAKVESAARPGVWIKGRVDRIGGSVSNDGQRQGRRFEVRIVLEPTLGQLRPGTSCHAEIVTQAKSNTLAVPMAAVQFDRAEGADSNRGEEDQPYVFVAHGSVARRTPVQLGISNDTFQEVSSGLKAGDTVVTGPYPVLRHLSDGDSLKPAGDPAREPPRAQ